MNDKIQEYIYKKSIRDEKHVNQQGQISILNPKFGLAASASQEHKSITKQTTSVQIPPLKIAISGKRGSGKDSAGDWLRYLYGGSIYKFADSLYDITYFMQNTLGVSESKNGALLQDTAAVCIKFFGDDIFAKTLMDEISNQAHNIFITDLRRKVELDHVKKAGFVTLRINCSEHVRRSRIPNDNRSEDHPTECELDNEIFDYTIENENDISQFHIELNGMINKIAEKNGYKFK